MNQIGKEVAIFADMLCSKNTKLGEVEIIAKFTANNPEVVAAVRALSLSLLLHVPN